MSYKVKTIPPFDKQIKRLAKKFPSLKNDYALLIHQLEIKPSVGIPIGNNCFKIRMAIASKGKGKSGGARIITHILVSENAVYLLAIYDKSEQVNMPDAELKSLLAFIAD